MRRTRLFVCLSFIVLLLAVADLFFGAISLPSDELLQTFLGEPPSEFLRNILWEYRFPKMLTALLVGMALPTSGLLMQRFFRNPMAGPFVLGISSGATLGAACAILISGVGGMLGVFTIAGAATLGALAILLLILVAAIRLQGQNTILILGILLSALALGVVNILQYTSNEHALKLFVIWTMGSLSEVSSTSLLFLALGTLLGLILAFFVLASTFHTPTGGCARHLTRFVATSHYNSFVSGNCAPRRGYYGFLRSYWFYRACCSAHCAPDVPHLLTQNVVCSNATHWHGVPSCRRSPIAIHWALDAFTLKCLSSYCEFAFYDSPSLFDKKLACIQLV